MQLAKSPVSGQSLPALTLRVFDARLLPIQMVRRIVLLVLILGLLTLAACSSIPGLGSGASSPSTNQVTYDGAIAFSIKKGQIYPGTTVSYVGRTSDGRAIISIGGQQSPKSTADSVNFVGAPVAGTQLTLNTRVGTYDDNSVNLFGTIHLVVEQPTPVLGTLGPTSITAFGIPVNYSVNKGASIPGSTVVFLGKSDQGAQFNNVEGVPYRQQFDSVVWNGHLRDKVGLRLDLRVISYSDDSVTLVGTAQVRFEK